MAVKLTANDLFLLLANLSTAPAQTDLIDAFIRDINARLGDVRLIRIPFSGRDQDHIFQLGSGAYEFDSLKLEGMISQIPMETLIHLANATRLLGTILGLRKQTETDREKLRQLTDLLDFQKKRLASSEEVLSDFLTGISDVFIGMDHTFSVCIWNPAAERMLGLPSSRVMGQNLWEVAPELQTAEIEMALIETEATRSSSTFLQEIKIGSQTLNLRVTVFPGHSGFSLVMQDQTREINHERENRAYLEKLRHAQKLESLGVLAGGIAHDFNNLLMGILGNVSLAQMDLPRDSPACQCLDDIEHAAKRAADLSSQMLAYSGRGKFTSERVNATELIQNMANLLKAKASLPRSIELEYDLEPNLPEFLGDTTQIHQLLMNVILNASKSIEGDGMIRIRSGNHFLDADEIAGCYLGSGILPGPWIHLSVEDNGSGMSQETLSRIFDPFFSTKFTGRGLGLAAALGIVRAHNGTLRVRSEPGQGTVFDIFLPPALEEEEPPAMNQTSRFSATWNGSGIVLFVDDEETVRSVGKRLLSRMGFEVLLAQDGVEAVEVFSRYKDMIGLVIMDMTMPRMDGREALEHIKKIAPEVRIVLSTGYSERDVAANFLSRGFDAFIQKPYNYRELKELVRMVMMNENVT